METKVKTTLGIIIIIILVTTIGVFVWQAQNKAQNSNQLEEQRCTKEAKVCPDGTAVGRTGPNCEFAPCPGEKNCAKEGETISTMPTPTGLLGKQCCSELSQIGAVDNINGECVPQMDIAICADCPNGVCGLGENRCNCPEDCGNEIDTSNWQIYRNKKYGFEFRYPKNWYQDGNRLSPQKIEDYEIGSDNAPIHFGIYSRDKEVFLNNTDILPFDFDYSISNCKRNNPDSIININGLNFNKYDLIDYGRYEGDSAGNIMIVVSSELDISDKELFIAFEWEEKPGGKEIIKNNSKDFHQILSTFKFIASE